MKAREVTKQLSVTAAVLAAVSLMILSTGCERKVTVGWMTYRNDIARSGVANEPLVAPLALDWVFRPVHAPRSSWYEPSEEIPRTHFDMVHHTTAAGGRVFFGSTVDNKVYALDAKTGAIRWEFMTEGPVRCVPTFWDNRVYFGSDDGFVYCVKARNGGLVWKYRAGPGDTKVLGNENMISLWPVRTSVLVDDNMVYFGAGVFPGEGIYICALDAKTGRELWKNDTIGDRAHELAYNGISPQGYLVASDNVLYVPSGRALPAGFDRHTGEFLFYMEPGSKFGGTWALLAGDELITGVDRSGVPVKGAYNIETGARKGDKYAWYNGVDMVIDNDALYIATNEGVYGMSRSAVEDAEAAVKANNDTKKQLNAGIKELKEKVDGAGAKTKQALTKQIDDLNRQIADLNVKNEDIKASSHSWKYLCENLHSLLLAGGTLIAGGDGFVAAINTKTGEEAWRSDVEGAAYGLAASEGRLFASTDTGNLYCFREGGSGKGTVIEQPVDSSPYPNDRLASVYESAAREIAGRTGIMKGYCLVLGAGEGRLAYEIAKLTDMNVIGIETNARNLSKAKRNLDSAGLLGHRVRIENWDLAVLPDYFANLIVSDKTVASGSCDYPAEEIGRILRPCGGTVFFGQPPDKKGFDPQKALTVVKNAGVANARAVTENGQWVMGVRGALEGAGQWTQVFADPQNSACSGDDLVSGSLGVLWFGAPGPKGIIDRHAETMSPVSMDGRYFIQGEEFIEAYDAYNGTFLWRRDIPGAVRVKSKVDGGNLTLTHDGLYVAALDKCHRLNPATGETMHEYSMPTARDGSPRRWAYISVVEGVLYGSAGEPLKSSFSAVWNTLVGNGAWKEREQVPEVYRGYYDTYSARYTIPDENARRDFKRSATLWRPMADWPRGGEFYIKGAKTDRMLTSDMIFALDTDTGEPLWVHNGKEIAHISIAMGDGRLFFTENAITAAQKNRAVANRKELARKGIFVEGKDWNDHMQGKMGYTVGNEDIDARQVIALDAVTGKKLWENLVDLTGCSGDAMGAAYHGGMLFFFGNYGNHDAWRHSGDQLRFRRINALSADTGDVVWSKSLNYRTRPLFVGDSIIIEPRACDCRTGEIVMREHPVTDEQVEWEFLRPGHTCAVTSASSSMLFMRSWTTLMYDFEGDRGVTLFGAIRPGCFINMIPANGILLMPEASSGCTCSFPIRCSVAFKPRVTPPEDWAVFVTHGDMTPVRHFAINLGAPADMKDTDGTVWFGYPNPDTNYGGNHYPNYGVKFNLRESVLDDMGFFARDYKGTAIQDTERPWLFTSGCLGLTKCAVAVLDSTETGTGVFTVRLGFMPQPGDRSGSRIFDIMLEGTAVLENFDVAGEAGSSHGPVVREFSGIEADKTLDIEFVPKANSPDSRHAPLINFIEILAEGPLQITDADLRR